MNSNFKSSKQLLHVAVLAALGAVVLSPAAQAATSTWNCNDDFWQNTGCWNPAVLPVTGDFVNVNTVGGTNTVLKVDAATGTTNRVGKIIIDATTGTTVTLQQSGGVIRGGSDLSIGNLGAGAFIQTGGSTSISNELGLGVGSTGNGTYNLSGTGTLSADVMNIGDAGTGAFTQSGGSVFTEFGLTVGGVSTGTGTYNLIGGSLTTGEESIGSGGTGTFNQTGGTHNAWNGFRLGVQSTGNGMYNLSGGDLRSQDSEVVVGYAGTGTFNQSGGTNTEILQLTLGRNSTGNGTYNLTGGILNVGNIVGGAGYSVFNLNGGTLNLTGSATGLDEFNVVSTSTVDVGGTLEVTSGLFTNNGVLKGTGTVAGNVVSSGSVGPGASPGTLTIDGDYTQTALGSFDAEIGGLVFGSQYDVLSVTGTATLAGILNVSLYDLGGGVFAPQAGNSFDILTADVLSGSFDTLNFATLLAPSLFWNIEYLIDAFGSTDVVRLSVQQSAPAVPVPAAAWLFGSGLLGLIGIAKRKRVE